MSSLFDDNTVFDRLADGELAPAERQELLASLDEREGGWRQCALALLEAQTWGQQFKELVAERPEEKLVAVVQQERSRVSVVGLISLAAGLLVAFAVGWLVRSPAEVQPSELRIASEGRQEIVPVDEIPGSQLSDDEVVTLVVRDASGKNRRIRVPLIQGAESKDRFDGSEGLFSAALRSNLQEQGLGLQSRRRYAPLFFEQDRRLVPMVVPVEDTYVVPVSRPVY